MTSEPGQGLGERAKGAGWVTGAAWGWLRWENLDTPRALGVIDPALDSARRALVLAAAVPPPPLYLTSRLLIPVPALLATLAAAPVGATAVLLAANGFDAQGAVTAANAVAVVLAGCGYARHLLRTRCRRTEDPALLHEALRLRATLTSPRDDNAVGDDQRRLRIQQPLWDLLATPPHITANVSPPRDDPFDGSWLPHSAPSAKAARAARAKSLSQSRPDDGH